MTHVHASYRTVVKILLSQASLTYGPYATVNHSRTLGGPNSSDVRP